MEIIRHKIQYGVDIIDLEEECPYCGIKLEASVSVPLNKRYKTIDSFAKPIWELQNEDHLNECKSVVLMRGICGS